MVELLVPLVVGVVLGGGVAWALASSRRPSHVVVVQDGDGRWTSIAGPYGSAGEASSAAQRAGLDDFRVERLQARPEPTR